MAVASYLNQPKINSQPAGAGGYQATNLQNVAPMSQTANTSTARITGMPAAGRSQSINGMPPGGVSPVRPSTPPQTPTASTPTTSTGSNFNLPQWTPPTYPSPTIAPPSIGQGGVEKQFFDTKGLFDPNQFKVDDTMEKYIESMLPVAQFGQNNFQYRNDFTEAQRRYNLDLQRGLNQDDFQRQLASRQQLSAEEQARLAADQWNRQFGHTSEMDRQGLDLARVQTGNQFQLGLDQNQATRDVANTYANANRYEAELGLQGQQHMADQQLAGTRYASDQDRIAAMYGADQSLRQAGLYSDAQRYAAELGLQEAQGYANAQRYGADQQLAGQQYAAQLGLQEAQGYAAAQRYGADQGLAGTRYQSDTERQMAQMQNQFLYAQLAQQAQQQELERQNMMRMTAMQAYGRSQSPQANWSRNWG
jgi:hypothetical protein